MSWGFSTFVLFEARVSERAGTNGQLKESEVGCLYKIYEEFFWSYQNLVVSLYHMYLKTPTHTLTVPTIRKVVCETIKWCETNVGTKRKKLPLTFKVTSVPFADEPAYGQYDPATNRITIDRSVCPDVRTIVRVTLHEYCHFLQDLRRYSKVLSEVGYQKHPQEVEARVMETMYSICWKDIKNKL